ncbi:MAG: hypothetical protein U9N48_04690 [Euryarchaeota archaeon]|nr:hypothetical protein [Euryarchaeota archaeon]
MFVAFAAQGLVVIVVLLSLRQSSLRDQHVWFVRGVASDGDGMGSAVAAHGLCCGVW